MTARTSQVGRGQIGAAQTGSTRVSSVGAAISISPSAGHTAAAVTVNVTYTGGATTSLVNPFVISSGPGSISGYAQDSSTTCHFTYTQVGASSTPTVFTDTVAGLSATWTNAAVVPGAPTSVVGTPGNATASIAFTGPADNGGASITGYIATLSPGGATFSAASSPIAATGLTNGVAYTATVVATNSVGDSVASSASAAFTPSTVPGAPTIGTAVAGNTSGLFAFSAPGSNGGSSILDYRLTISPGGATFTGSTSPITATGLSNGTGYTGTVAARNANGYSAESAASNSVTPSTLVSKVSVAPFVDSDTLTTVACQAYQNVSGTMTAAGSAPTPFTIASVTNGRGALVQVAPNGNGDGSFHGVVRWDTGAEMFADEFNIPPSTYVSDSTATVTKICTLPPGTDVSGTVGYQIRDSNNATVGSYVTTGILDIPGVTDGLCADITGAVGFSGFIVWDNGAGVYSTDELNIPGRFGSGTGGGATRGRVVNGN